MFDLEGKWPNKAEQISSTLGLSEKPSLNTPPVHDITPRQRASFQRFKTVQMIFLPNFKAKRTASIRSISASLCLRMPKSRSVCM